MLPYSQFAAVTASNNEVLGTVALQTWQESEPRQTPTGDVWSWSGEAEIEAALLLCDVDTNRRLYVVDDEAELPAVGADDGPPPGRRLQVVSAVRHAFLPHVELRLNEMRGSGN